MAGTGVAIGPNHVLTAAHNCYNEGINSTKMIFIPQFDDGSKQLGQFDIEQMSVMPGWNGEKGAKVNSGRDLAIHTLKKNKEGKTIKDVVGTMPTIQGEYESYTTFGYCNKYSGRKKMHEQIGTRVEQNNSDNTPCVTGDMDGGTSGGPLLIKYKTGKYYVAGIRSSIEKESNLT